MARTVRNLQSGEPFGDWTVIKMVSETHARCKCVCGAVHTIYKYNLLSGQSKRCGDKQAHVCKVRYKKQRVVRRRFESNTLRGLSTELYICLANKVSHAISRCTDRGHIHWAYYGGRGISVFPKWIDRPEEFVEYLLTLPGHDDKSLELDRIENDGNYEPGNLRFVTHSESMQNRRARQKDRKGRFLPSVLSSCSRPTP